MPTFGTTEKSEELKLKSIAFPAVSAGIYGCPLEEVVKTLIEVVKEFARTAKSVKEVFCSTMNLQRRL